MMVGSREGTKEFLSSLPSSWQTVPIKAACYFTVSNVDKHSLEDEIPVRLCNYTDVYKNDCVSPELELMAATATEDEIAKFHLEVGDVVITKDSESWDDIGIAAYVEATAEDFVCGYHLAFMRPNKDSLDGRFLFRCVQSRPVALQLELEATGVTRYGLPKGAIGNALIPLPPLEIQRLIADYLDRETTRIDALVAEKEKMLALLEEKRAALISRAVTRGLNPDAPLKPSGLDWLGDIPAHWETRRIRFIADFVGGSTPATKEDAFWEGGITPWVSPKDMKTRIIVDTEDHLTDEGLGNCASGLLEPGHVLIVVRSGILRHTIPVAVNAVPVALNQDIRAFLLDDQVLPEYLAWFIEGKQQPLIEQWCKAVTTVESVEMEYLRDSVVPVPPLKEQRSIAEGISKSSERLNRLGADITNSTNLLKERRAALITAAVTGQIPIEEMSA